MLESGGSCAASLIFAGYTSTGQYEDSSFMTSGSEDAELMKQVYAEVGPPHSPVVMPDVCPPPPSRVRVCCAECVDSTRLVLLTSHARRRQASSLKSREASSENVLRVAKETLDARKRQIKTLTASLKKMHMQLMALKGHDADRGESHGSATVSLSEVDPEGVLDPEDDGEESGRGGEGGEGGEGGHHPGDGE